MATRQPPILGDDRAYGNAWAATSFGDRRRITRAITRGEVLEDGVEAQLAVMTARRQITFWRWGWLIGPALTLLQYGTETLVFIITMIMSGMATGGLSWFFLRRARHSIAVNIDLAEHAAKKAAAKSSGKAGNKPHPKSKEAATLAAERAANRKWWQRSQPR